MKREKLEIIYSIIVLVAIPVIIVANTVIFALSTREDFNDELGRKGDLSNGIIAQYNLDLIKNKQYERLSTNLNTLEDSQPTLMHSVLIVSKGSDFVIVARSSSAADDNLNDTTKQLQASGVVSTKRPVSNLVNTYDRDSNPVQALYVMSPVIDSDKNVIAIVAANYLTVDAEKAIASTYQQSFIILVISIVLIFGLLFRHIRLVGYIKLLAKQKELNQTMSDFLSVATHELKAPTSIIKGYLSNVIDGDFGPVEPKVKEQIDVAISQTERLNSLVQDLLNVSHIEQGRIEYKFAPVDTVKVINTIVENYRPIAEGKGIKLIFEPVAQAIPPAYADAGRVQEVFTNLIDNAIKYTAAGSVTISQQLQKGILVTNVRDTGFGISPAAKQRLFSRFYRVQTSQTQGISGTGLGLWIIKQYVEAMNGTINFETMEGVGSNFIVELQVAPKSA